MQEAEQNLEKPYTQSDSDDLDQVRQSFQNPLALSDKDKKDLMQNMAIYVLYQWIQFQEPHQQFRSFNNAATRTNLNQMFKQFRDPKNKIQSFYSMLKPKKIINQNTPICRTYFNFQNLGEPLLYDQHDSRNQYLLALRRQIIDTLSRTEISVWKIKLTLQQNYSSVLDEDQLFFYKYFQAFQNRLSMLKETNIKKANNICKFLSQISVEQVEEYKIQTEAIDALNKFQKNLYDYQFMSKSRNLLYQHILVWKQGQKLSQIKAYWHKYKKNFEMTKKAQVPKKTKRISRISKANNLKRKNVVSLNTRRQSQDINIRQKFIEEFLLPKLSEAQIQTLKNEVRRVDIYRKLIFKPFSGQKFLQFFTQLMKAYRSYLLKPQTTAPLSFYKFNAEQIKQLFRNYLLNQIAIDGRRPHLMEEQTNIF